MFHGTTVAELIAKSINGVDIYWGKDADKGYGAYFAFNFAYSYTYSANRDGDEKQMLVCKVMPGNTTD